LPSTRPSVGRREAGRAGDRRGGMWPPRATASVSLASLCDQSTDIGHQRAPGDGRPPNGLAVLHHHEGHDGSPSAASASLEDKPPAAARWVSASFLSSSVICMPGSAGAWTGSPTRQFKACAPVACRPSDTRSARCSCRPGARGNAGTGLGAEPDASSPPEVRPSPDDRAAVGRRQADDRGRRGPRHVDRRAVTVDAERYAQRSVGVAGDAEGWPDQGACALTTRSPAPVQRRAEPLRTGHH
jgi:hypothetical protein